MDLIGHDVNYAVTESVYAANYFDKRYVPSLVQRELVDGGLFGRKSGRGFYDYANGAPQAKAAGARTGDVAASAQLVVTDGRTAAQIAAETKQRDVAVFDWALGSGGSLAYALAEGASEAFAKQVEQAIAASGHEPLRVGDAPGLVVARTVAMLVNEAADAVQQGVCDPTAADTAMKLGVNYPAGPFEWLDKVGTARVVELLGALAAHYGGERYRTSPWLARRRLQERTA
jgi:3-hydroxybutyryl-CoA dehydrogenase